jgi:hypothetical protein
MKLTEHFDLSEFTVSQEAVRSGIDNTPTEAIIGRLVLLCLNVLEPIRDLVDAPLIISSGYRSPELNKLIGGSESSQHCKGEAADFHCPRLTVEDLFGLIRSSNIPFDQCIQEFGRWVHVSYQEHPRREALYASKKEGKTVHDPA